MLKKIIMIIQLVIFSCGASALASQTHHAIIIDAGSSGSRLHLFEYVNTETLPEIKDILSIKVKPGLSSFADEPDKAGPSLQPLLTEALATLQQQHIEPDQVSMQILATAGVRLLPDEKVNAIYASMTEYLTSHYHFKDVTIKTVAEKMEGLYGWLDVNYLANNFSHEANKTEGILDLGGASTEITFAIPQSFSANDEISLTINGKHYTVFSKNFLGLGQDQARMMMDKGSFANRCYPVNYPLDNKTVGDYQFANCKSNFMQIIKQHRVIESLPPMAQQHFTAYAAFYYVTQFFNLDKTPDQASVEWRIEQVCSQSWEQLQRQYPKTPQQFLSIYCASGAYISDLLYDTYHLTGNNITIATEINHQEIDWPMGALIYSLINERQE